VNGLVKSSSVFQSEGDNPVVVEVACEKNGKCSIDHRAYKGVFARTYARAALAAPIVAESIGNILSSSAKGAIKSCKGSDEDVACSLTWTQPVAGMQLSAKDGNIGEVFSALEVVQGLLYSSVSKDLNVANGSNTSGGNNTKGGDASRTSGVPSQSTGAAGSVAVNGFAVIAVAFAAALPVIC
jgi:mannan endo-1,6-alpha-mannosidase